MNKIKCKSMKKVNIFLLVAVIAIGITSCEKEESKSIKASEGKKLVYKLDDIPIQKHESNSKSVVTDINQLMTNPDDSDDEKINNYLYQISLATRDLIKDPEFNQIIIDLAEQSEINSANLLDLENVAPDYYNIINNNLSESELSLHMIADDLTHAPVAPNTDYPVTAELEHYVPAIFVPNIENADADLQPLISPNVVVDSREDTTYEDNVITWFFENEEDEDVVEIMLSEETAISTHNPVFILDNASFNQQVEIDYDFEPLNTEISDIIMDKSGEEMYFGYQTWSVNEPYRYESFWSGNTDFAVVATRIDTYGNDTKLYGKKEYKMIDKIPKHKLGYLVHPYYFDPQIEHAENWLPYSNPWTPGVIQNGVNMVYWNTFERDWNRSPKNLGAAVANNTGITLEGNMKYNSNWYAWIPSTVHVHYTRFEWMLYPSWAHWNNSWKSKLLLARNYR